jgi:uncharacterized membrane protein
MIIATIPTLFAVVGVLMFYASKNPKLVEIGKIMFFCGLLVALFALGHSGPIKLLP